MRTTASGVPIHVGRQDVRAECRECDFAQYQKNAMGLAAQHAKKTGHEVWVDTERAIVFNFRKPR